ncbi:YkvA family protein [Bradyrhizobium erythrophlei]|uniref:DUF1232 domain-containing protein n=1 Tax=Bradyrhizobium erythrophlei TaxID=1437360 RepID=A0A1M5W220_9BRAD|nr:YkvA family protein [Bradyrhizobium erythrophlei]SHH81542.1 Protein of unknown function [Bradyrhizobium erythrophlei]
MTSGRAAPVRSLVTDIKIWARGLRRDAHAVYLAAHDTRVPWYAKTLAIAVAGYALSPVDLIPDFIPVLGYIDDLIIVPLGIAVVVSLIPNEVMAEYRTKADEARQRPRSRGAAIVIVAIWISGAAALGWAGYAYWNR